MQAKVKKSLHLFFGKFKVKSFAKGEKIIKPDINNKIFFLTRGVVKMSHSSKGKDAPTLNIYKPNAFFPMPLVFGKKDRYTYSALTNVQGHFAPKSDFANFLKKNPDVLFDLLKRIYQGFDGFFISLEALLSGNALSRILTKLVIYARRFGQESETKITFDWHLTHQELAAQTGLARESVTREIKKLQRKGLIGYSGKKLFIPNLQKLEEELKLPLDNLAEL